MCKLVDDRRVCVFLFAFAKTYDRGNTDLKSLHGFLQRALVGLAKIFTSLAVSDDHVRAASRPDHRAGHFAGKSTLLGPTQVLGANLYSRAAGRSDRTPEVKK